jgi:hypothetical protein
MREDWRTDRARLVWFFAHAGALAILVVLTLGRGRVFWIVGGLLAASYYIGYVVLGRRAIRRDSSANNEPGR